MEVSEINTQKTYMLGEDYRTVKEKAYGLLEQYIQNPNIFH